MAYVDGNKYRRCGAQGQVRVVEGITTGSSSGSRDIHIPFLDARQTSLLEKEETNPFSNVI